MIYPNLTTLALVLRKTPSAEKTIIQRLDRSISLDSESVEDNLFINFDLTQWKMSTGEDQTQSVHAYDLVHVFAKEEKKFKSERDSNLIEHPLVQKMLEDAWTRNMRNYYIVIFVFKFIFMAMTAAYILLGRNPYWLCVCLLFAAILDLVRNIIAVVSFARGPTATKWKETLCFYYLANFQFYCYLTQLVGSFALFFLRENELLLEMCGPMIFLAGFFDVVLMFGELKVFGLYMDMFYCVLMNFFKILRAFGIFLVGYVICFWLYFHQQNSFSMFLLAITKVIVMFIGEMDYNDLIENYLNQTIELTAHDGTSFNISPSEAPQWYLIFPLMCICLFVIAVPIVLQGLLIGIVVSDIAEIKTKAAALQLKRNANHLEYVVNSIDSIFSLLLNFVEFFGGGSKMLCNCDKFILKAQMGNKLRVAYSLENDSHPEYLHMAYEIASRNASNVNTEN